MIDEKKVQVSPENAERVRAWLATRGGLAVWGCQDLSNPGMSWSTPATHEDGSPATKPHWSASEKPVRVVTSEGDVEVLTEREVRRIKIAYKKGDSFNYVLTEHSSWKLRKALKEAGEFARHAFDYFTQEAVILVPDKVVPLSEWKPSPAGGTEDGTAQV